MRYLVAMAVLGAVLTHSSALGTDYYVRDAGSDVANGQTPATAWATVAHAVNQVAAGDRIYVGGGTYSGLIDANVSGTATNPIQIVADTTGAWTGDSGQVLLTNPGAIVIDVDNTDYVEFSGFTVSGGRNSIDWDNSVGGRIDNFQILDDADDGFDIGNVELTVTNTTVANCVDNGFDIELSSTVTLINVTVRNTTNDGIIALDGPTTLDIQRCTVEDCSGKAILVQNGTFEITNSLIVNNNAGVEAGTIGTTTLDIWHCTIASNTLDGVKVGAGTVTVTNSIIVSNGDDGLELDAGSLTHTYNVVWGNTYNFDGTSQDVTETLADPLFAASNDYRLLTGSPAIDFGTDASGVTTVDRLAQARPGGAGWDVGCYEGVVVYLFDDVTSAAGVADQTTSSYHHGSGLHWADLDDDGDLDALVTGATARLWTNNNAGASFTSSVFVGSVRRSGALLDLDNDGDVDFWAVNVNSYDIETAYENTGSMIFSDAGDLGMGAPTNNEGLAAADVDLDGRADIVMFSGDGNWIGHNTAGTPAALTATNDTSYGLNDTGDWGNGNYASSSDVNGDGYSDFYYNYGTGKLFLSDGDGTYTENASGISVVTGNDDKTGTAWGDYDNDGDLDLFVPRYDAGSPGYLWRNDSGTFTNVAATTGLDDTSGQRSAAWGDYDNDGDLDLYIVTHLGSNVLYRNDGSVFTEVLEGAYADGNGHDAVFVDYDNDGDLDIAATREDDTARLYQNNTDDLNYLKVRLIGAGAGGTNKAAIGVRVDVYDATGTTFIARRDVGNARGYGGTEPPWLHFGGLDAATTYLVRVHFVSGAVDVSVVPGNVSTDISGQVIPQMITIEESTAERRVIQWREVRPN